MFEDLLMPTHLILILLVVLIVFGPGKLPELGQALGKSIRSFKSAFDEESQKGERKDLEEKR